MVELLHRYAKLYETRTILDRSNIINISFNRTQIFKELVQSARREKAFTQFLHMLDNKGIFEKFDIDVIGRLFFTNKVIYNMTIEEIDAYIKQEKPLLYDEMKNIRVGQSTLLDAIKQAIKQLQDTYKDSNVDFSFDKLLNSRMLDIFTKLHSLAYEAFKQLRDTQYTMKDIIIKKPY